MRIFGIVVLSLLACVPVGGQQPAFTVSGLLGYQRGLGVEVLATAANFAQGFPFSVRLRVGRTSTDPGDPAIARKVFINDATNGTPVEHGHTWNGGLDILVPRGRHSRLWAGVRYTHFLGNFKFVGGNEDFDVRSASWGLAGGADLTFPMTPRMALLVSAGAEVYSSGRLQAHDTSYSPDGQNVNPRGGFTYQDADRAVNQPRLRPTLMVGVSRRLGR